MSGPTRTSSATLSLPRTLLVLAWAILSSIPTLAIAQSIGDDVQFLRDIQPILSEHCTQCHGVDAKKREGGLRLDTWEGMKQGGDSGDPAVVPNQPEASPLLQRIHSTDEGEVMPPPELQKPLSQPQKELLERWIREGAVFQQHWAFEKPQATSATPPHAPNAIDAMVAQKWAQRELTPQPEADPRTLCRRLYLDLIGLPPSPQEIQEFLQTGYEATVQRLLHSERFGEKWARHWLDVARYSDTNGYEKDLRREQWIWRDWVVQAFNQDMPYDRFIIEQIAGDLLPNSTSAQRIATGFLRNSMLNEEGAIVPEQFRMVEMFDRIDCIGKAVLGLSTQCAQCHDHKFDPITMSEYYRLFAMINNTYEAQSWVYSEAQQQTLDSLQQRLRRVDSEAQTRSPDWNAKLSTWEQSLEPITGHAWKPLAFHQLEAISGLNHPVQLEDQSVLMLGHTSSDIFYVGNLAASTVTGIRLEILPHGDLPNLGPGRNSTGTWSLLEAECFYRSAGTQEWTKLKLGKPTADFSQPLTESADKKKRSGPIELAIDGTDDSAWTADRGAGRRNQASVAIFPLESPLVSAEGGELKWVMRMGEMIGCCRVSVTDSPTPGELASSAIDYAAIQAMQIPAEQRGEAERQLIFRQWIRHQPDMQDLQATIDQIYRDWPEPLTSVMHLAEREPGKQRVTYRLDRGEWDRPMEAVKPGVISALHAWRPEYPENRLGFAYWLVDRESPLAARVAVNRVWQAMFGTGLVETTEDFGTRVTLPIQRDLLDYLAVDFMRQNWSHKKLIESIVLSQTYRRASNPTPAMLEVDPNNQYLARGPRFRAEAEVLRDVALAVAGRLTHRLGGPSVIPPVPKNVLDYNYTYPSYWTAAGPPERYRRALYAFRKRSMPDPAMSSFDSPNGDFACARRLRSNTPIAALVALNEPIFVEAAQGLALRVLSECTGDDITRIAFGFELATGRLPTPDESHALMLHLTKQRQRLADGWLNPRAVLSGDPGKLPDLPPNASPQDAAAWTLLARVLLNLDETLTKS